MSDPARRASIRKLALLALPLVGVLTACDRPVERAWTWAGTGPSRSGLLQTPGGVLFGNEAGWLVRVGWDGKTHWRVQLGREIAARPAVVGDRVVAATLGGEWIAVSLGDGSELWRLGGKTASILPLAGDDARAYSVAEDGSVLAISAKNGGTVWKLLPPRGLEKDTPVTHGPELLDGRLFVALRGAGLFALQPKDGEQLWRRELGDVIGFLAEGARIYALTADGTVHALEAATGKSEWSRKVEGTVERGPWLARGLLWVSLEKNGIVAVDPQDGSEAWRATLAAPVRGGVAEYRELVLIPTAGSEGLLYGLRPGQPSPIFEVRADSPLRSTPRVQEDLVLVQALDGRTLAWRIRRTSR